MRTMWYSCAALLLACVLVGGLVSGCKEKPVEKENTEKIDLWENATNILADVQDKKGLEVAKPKLMEIADKLRKMDEEEQERKKNHATRPVVSKDMKARLDEVTNRKFGPQYARLSQVDGCKLILDEFLVKCNAAQK